MHSESAQILQMIGQSPTEMKGKEEEGAEVDLLGGAGFPGMQVSPFLGIPGSMGPGANFLMMQDLDHKAGFTDLPHSLSQ